MNMTGVSLLGWIHTLACTLAILSGALVLLREKGTARHRRMGRIYLYAMLVALISSFGVYHFDVRSFVPFRGEKDVFGIFHWESVFTLFFLLLALFAASRQKRALWAYVHPVSMLITYYMLIGGLVNEVFVRVAFLRELALSEVHGAGNPVQTPIAGLTQMAALAGFLILLVMFVVQVARRRRRIRLLPIVKVA